MKISIVTDEISSDLETAVELAADWGIHDLELRGYGSQRVPGYSNYQKQRVLELMDEYQVQIVAISPGLFKIPYPDRKRDQFPLEVIDAGMYGRWRDAHSLLDYHCRELFPASLEYANEIKATKVVIFSFARGSDSQVFAPDEVLECLQNAADQAQKAGIELVIEVEDHFWADTGVHTADLIQKINHPALGVNWDAGNAFAAGDIPFPDGYQAIRNYVKHVHFKDLICTTDGTFQYAVNGEIDWNGQIRALVEDDYQGFISVEPHMQPKVASSKAVYQRLKSLIEINTRANTPL
jgi:sugar phosphate isomerase/epimerase